MSDCTRRHPTGRLASHHSLKHIFQPASDAEDCDPADTVNLKRKFHANQGKIESRCGNRVGPCRIAAMVLFPLVAVAAVVYIWQGGLGKVVMGNDVEASAGTPQPVAGQTPQQPGQDVSIADGKSNRI